MKISSLLAPLFPGVDRPLCGDDSPATLDAWDSLKQIEIILTLEEAFRVDLSTREIVDLKTVASIVQILRDRGLDADI